jgi:hypothetical protein
LSAVCCTRAAHRRCVPGSIVTGESHGQLRLDARWPERGAERATFFVALAPDDVGHEATHASGQALKTWLDTNNVPHEYAASPNRGR